ncbi:MULTISPECIES: hypothetical protein [unclassified Polynucleobacter]|jgi:hypothetical protein|uniref:hypothetical protein n=1 Tax=unclassified Polynucleobacter TaxID=2640945 RepID=UPI000BCAB8CB|nr:MULTISPECIES: hypothetical protein [unclassified Polynucleobacter]OYY21495.1 MAG: hypothetical protein B7Y67_01500 [Polynucleobacter sp. 35-46-11]OZA78020.1 MAG: hypothetical protein B7X71_02620 [Polynucleobacter sp. 39-46-10]
MRFTVFFLAITIASFSTAAIGQTFKFVALGDMPYSPPKDFQRFQTLITEINRLKPSFSIFIGDTKSGSSLCSDEHNQTTKSYFSSFKAPLIYSPGDNEWTDCHRPLAGAYDPLERLEALRSVFFSTNHSLGKNTIRLQRQADVSTGHSKYVENSYWIKNNFLFVSIHIPGSNNNNEGTESATKEYQDRNQANLAWIDKAFDLATQRNLNGIIFAFQADMFYKPSQLTSSDSGYRDTLESFISMSEIFNKPVLLIHGDSHQLKIDQPLYRKNQKKVLENVLRLQVMGADQVQAVEVQVNPAQEQLFIFRPIILKENN